MGQKSIVFFDLDDTIIDLTVVHKEAIKSGLEKTDISIQDGISKYIDIYKKNRYANPQEIFQMVLENEGADNAAELSELANTEYVKFIDSNLNDYVNSDFHDSLEKLESKGFEVGIITQGKEDIQQNKLDILNMKDHIDPGKTFIVESKDEKTYSEIKENFPDYACWSIGDREDGDVIEPRKAGFNIVRFRNPTSKNYEGKTLDDYTEFETLKECVDYIINNASNNLRGKF